MNYFSFFSLLDWIALASFLVCWIGYTYLAKLLQTKRPTIANQLAANRKEWIEQMLEREVRIGDVTALGILQRNVTFFASTTVFIIAGLLTALGSSDQTITFLDELPLVQNHNLAALEFKFVLLVVTFAYAFFKFSWSVRQYNFAVVLFGAAPTPNTKQDEKQLFTKHANWLLTRATNSFNYGLRSYTFAIAILSWFIHPIAFIALSSLVAWVLYRREFKSSTLAALYNASHHNNEKDIAEDSD